MEEIKFRAWLENDKYMAIQGTPDIETLQSFIYHFGDQPILMQYTGLHDKNGTEIYENDILEEGQGYYFEVVWDDERAKFKLQWVTKSYQYPEWNRGIKMTVIGNIWENPDLLKED